MLEETSRKLRVKNKYVHKDAIIKEMKKNGEA